MTVYPTQHLATSVLTCAPEGKEMTDPKVNDLGESEAISCIPCAPQTPYQTVRQKPLEKQ